MQSLPAGVRGERALTAAAQLGPFFQTDPRPEPGWTSWAALTADPRALEGRAAEVARVLAAGHDNVEVEPGVVASLVHLGLIARLASPVLGAALVTGLLPLAPVDRVHVRLQGANPLPLTVGPTSVAAVDDPAALVAAFEKGWLWPAIDPLTMAVRGCWAVSRQVLDGNVTSAVAAALRLAAAARPELEGRARATLDALLGSESSPGTGRRRADGSFERRSCCLFYRVPGAGTCVDCILGDRA